ncbi:aminopeptidase P family protein [Fulvivirgaceae bacterium BMA10]|uniref:Xaa-Pro aminopeptidase n=1 Tax=Splendidivirga corallicola TaxID=3051826 RepID=A0ABT8KJ56_9BACT|nr:aminopeptidase P family protein [Fulvivirgaceae bacterium BMA10]
MFDRNIYINRREKLKQQVGSGLILLMGNVESSMNYKDNWYHFRQDSSFLYFFGLDIPGLVGIIDVDENSEIIFGDDLSMDDIVWTGPQPTIAELASKSGVDQVKTSREIATMLSGAQNGGRKIHFLPPYRPENIIKLNAWLGIDVNSSKEFASVELVKAVVAQRSIKDEAEIQEIEKAVNITAEMHNTAMKTAREGLKESDITGNVHGVAVGSGGNLSFPIILTMDGQTLHNHYHGNVLTEGRMLLCDCGAETETRYAGDMTRTFPVGEKFDERQKTLYNIVLDAHETAKAALKPGILFKDVHLLACKRLAEGLKGLGLMKGDIDEAVQQGAHALFFQCGLGHMMGLDVHDMEDLGEEYVGYTDTLLKSKQFGLKSLRLGRALEPGFVLTVEPGIYMIPELMDMWRAENKFLDFINYDEVEKFKDFGGIRVEEDLLITENSSRLLGEPVAITAEAVEGIRAASLNS